MPTIVDYATEGVFWALDELERESGITNTEADINLVLNEVWDMFVLDIDRAVCKRYAADYGQAQHVKALQQFIAEHPVRQAALQAYCEAHIPNWERYIIKALPELRAGWRIRVGVEGA